MSSWVFNISPTSLGSLFQYWTTLTVKEHFLVVRSSLSEGCCFPTVVTVRGAQSLEAGRDARRGSSVGALRGKQVGEYPHPSLR